MLQVHNQTSLNITIGIQARSTSTRFPNKVNFELGESTVLERVIKACNSTTTYVSRWARKKGSTIRVVVCIPEGDPLRMRYRGKADIFEGPEHDVLTRYLMMARQYDSDFIVRITSDCPMILASIISKHIIVAVENGYDYTSNVDERCRTAPDGFDVEVISRALLEYTAKAATTDADREHVTTLIRRERPRGFNAGFVINNIDRSEEKLSLDTVEDAAKLKDLFDRTSGKRSTAEALYGAENVHTFA